MATIFRGPLYVSRSEKAPVLQVRAFAVPSLLVTLLAVLPAPMPLNAAHSMPLQVQHRPLVLNADTSRGTPKTLIGELVKPIGTGPPFFAPHPHLVLEQVNPDTSRGTAKTLLAELVVPRGTVAPFFPPHPHRAAEITNPDTSRGTAKTLLAELVVPRGTVAPWFAPVTKSLGNWLPADTTQDLQGTLRAVFVQPPLIVSPHFSPLRAKWQPADTTQDTPKTLLDEVVLPFRVAPHSAPARFWFQPADSTRGTAKPLYGDAVVPRVNLPYPRPTDFGRPVTDTSQSAFALARTLLSLPPGKATLGGAAGYVWQVADYTLPASAALYEVVVVVTPPTPSGVVPAGGPSTPARKPWDKRRRYVQMGERGYFVASERELAYLLSQAPVAALSKKPARVKVPAAFVAKTLNPERVESALRNNTPEIIDLIQQILAELDEQDLEIILLTLH